MKKQIITFALLIASISIFAQGTVSKGQSQINAGIGLSSWGVPVYIGFDYGVSQDITLGGELSIRSYNDNWSGNRYNHSVFGILGNANYHFNTVFNIPSDWDFYAGLNLGFYNWSSPNDYGGSHSSGFGLGAQIGGRYYFSNNIGINLELGGGNNLSAGKFGITIKI